MSKVVVDSDVWKDITRDFTRFYKYFTSVEISSIDSNKTNENWSSTRDFDFSLCPHKFFYMRFADKLCRILKMKKLYTIECINFIPSDKYPLFNPEETRFDIYRHLYGRFKDFESAKIAFYDITKNFIEFSTRPLF